MRASEQTPQEYFRLLLLTVVGTAFEAAGYHLVDSPTQWAGGLFTFSADLDGGLRGYIEFQLLVYIEDQPSRFRVTLTRSDQPNPAMPSRHPAYARRDLSALVVADFGVAILPAARHWWQYRTVEELGRALAEAGHLIVGYGLPWLDGSLTPPNVGQPSPSAT
jgi:hypothetical protein